MHCCGNYLPMKMTTKMNKIRSIKQLKVRQKKLEQRKTELEKAIRYDWLDVKNSMKPKNVAGQVFAHIFEKEQPNGDSTLASTLSQVAAMLTKIGVEKVEEKMAEFVGRKN